MQTQTEHTPGPWKVMPCPDHAGKHPYHDHRWIATADAQVERGHDERGWSLSRGSLIAQLRDGHAEANSRLIASAPALLAALQDVAAEIESLPESTRLMREQHILSIARAAITKATQP